MAEIPSLESLRQMAAEYRRKADEIERHVSALEALISNGSPPNLASSKRDADASGGGKGKPVGAISNRWREHYVALYRDHGKAPFRVDSVIARLKVAEGRITRPSEIHRLLKTHVSHNYLAQPSRETYQITESLINLIGLKSESPPASAEGQSVGGVAERLNASDSKSDGASLLPAPVGSNPTASVPTVSEPRPHDLFVPSSANPQPNDEKGGH